VNPISYSPTHFSIIGGMPLMAASETVNALQIGRCRILSCQHNIDEVNDGVGEFVSMVM
jgi:hypothetical protein